LLFGFKTNSSRILRWELFELTLRLFSFFVLTFILLFTSGVATPLLIALALSLALTLSSTLSGLLLLLRALTLVLFICHV